MAAIDCYKRLIYTDPTLEQAYQRLMILYGNRGMRSAALKVYEDCQKALQKELNLKPDPVTVAIYRQILEPDQGPPTDDPAPKTRKFLLGLASGYILWPFDLIPDYTTVIGFLDDIIVVSLLLIAAFRLVHNHIPDHRKPG